MHRAVPARSTAYAWRHARRRARRRLVAVAALALSACCLLLARLIWLPHHPQPPQLATQRVTALTPRPAFLNSGAAWTPAEVNRLRSDVAPVINGAAFPTSSAALIADARTGRALYARDEQLPLVPGSTIKLLTAAAALDALGSSFRFDTTAVTDGTLSAGNLSGNLWLIGGGDPELTSDDLRRGVHMITLRGIDGIAGNVYADGTRYGSDAVNATWLPEDLPYGWAAPASAISIDGGSVQFTVTPQPGSDATVAVDPPGAAQRVIASVSTVAADAANTLRIESLPDGSGYRVSGQIPYGAPQKYWRSVSHPTRAAADAFIELLKLAGVTVAGYAAEGRAPAGSVVLWKHRSRPLHNIVRRMFFDSDNHIAEELLRAVGWKSYGTGTLPASLAAMRQFLARHAISSGSAILADGSGLSATNKITAGMVAGALRILAQQHTPQAPYKLLPRAGMEGTVAVRNLDVETKGRVYAKDGYIGGASGLAGYVLTAHHGPVIFVFLVNDWEHGLDAVWDAEDQVLERLARY